jgi:hypothetical protein
MARYITNNPLITDIKGKLGKYNVFSKWKKTPIVRKAYKDTNVSPQQEVVRSAFNEADDLFLKLTRKERDAWRKYATKAKKGTNYSAFISHAMKQILNGELPATMPPA